MHPDFSKFKTVSFDLWDTLIQRDCHPDEIKYQFSRWVWLHLTPTIQEAHTSNSIYHLRKSIEDSICNEDWEYRFIDVVNELIRALGGKGSFNCLATPEYLEDVELHIENSHTSLRKEGIALLKSANSHCNNVVLISDFYHSSFWLDKLLVLKNLRDHFSSIYSSSDRFLTKRSGKIYDYLSSLYDVNTWVHIGDNEYADVNVPMQKKINSYYLPQGSQANYYSHRGLGLKSQLLASSNSGFIHDLRIKKIASSTVDASTSSKQGLGFSQQDGLKQVGRISALILAGFILQIIEDSIRLRTDKIYFFSREGIFFKQLYDLACEADVYHLRQYAKGEILDVSRLATFASSLKEVTIEEFMRIWRLYSIQSPAALLKSLNLSSEIQNLSKNYKGDIHAPVKYPWEDPDFLDFFNSDDFQAVVSKSIKAQRQQFLNYAESKKLSLVDKVIQIVDIGWRGTIQDNIALIFQDSKVHGNYLGLEKFLNPQPTNTSKRGFVGDNNDPDELNSFDFGDFAIFEFICNVPGGSVTGYSEDAQVNRTVVSGEESVILDEGLKIQAEIKRALIEIFAYVKKAGISSSSLRKLARDSIVEIKKNPPPVLCDAFNKLEHNEIFGTGAADQLLHASDISTLLSKNSAEKFSYFKELWEKCRWKQSLTSSTIFQNFIEAADPLSKLSLPSNMFNLVFQGLGNVRVCIIVPHVIKGSGGHRTIFNFAKGLIRAGAVVEIQLESFNDAISYVHDEMQNYQYTLTEYWQPGTNCDVAIATVGYSPEFVSKEIEAKIKFYLVQDYEASFNPVSDGYVNVQNSYNYGLIPLCVGTWLPHVLKTQHNVLSFYSGLGSDSNIYKMLNFERTVDVAFLYQPEKFRRLGDFCVKALNKLHCHMPNINVISYGSQNKPPLEFDSEHLGLVSDLDRLNMLYNQAKLGLCISLTNPSRIPYEMMRAGCVPVDVFRYNNLFDYAPFSATLSYQDSESIELAMMRLLKQPEDWNKYSSAALSFSRHRTLDWEVEVLVNSVNYMYHENGALPSTPTPIYKEKPVVCISEKHSSSVEAFCNWQKILSELSV